MILKTPLGNYRWLENWITIPDSPLGRTNGRTHGISVLKDGRIVLFHQADPGVLIYSAQGVLEQSWGHFPGAHGLTVVEEAGAELLWLTDQDTREVVKCTLDGSVRMRLPRPDHPAYQAGHYVPTWCAVAEQHRQGNGDIWVTDGYGCSLVHRFNAAGDYLGSLDGTEGAGRFACPHAITAIHRDGAPEFHIADRGNRRIQVYSTDGRFQRTYGSDFLNSPDIVVPMGKYLLVPELVRGLTLLDQNEKPITTLGVHPQPDARPDWPNNRSNVTAGLFNSPHSAGADAHGNIYIVEWITGGRVTKLERQPD